MPNTTKLAFLHNFNTKTIESKLREYKVDEEMLKMIMTKYKKTVREIINIKVIDDEELDDYLLSTKY